MYTVQCTVYRNIFDCSPTVGVVKILLPLFNQIILVLREQNELSQFPEITFRLQNRIISLYRPNTEVSSSILYS